MELGRLYGQQEQVRRRQNFQQKIGKLNNTDNQDGCNDQNAEGCNDCHNCCEELQHCCLTSPIAEPSCSSTPSLCPESSSSSSSSCCSCECCEDDVVAEKEESKAVSTGMTQTAPLLIEAGVQVTESRDVICQTEKYEEEPKKRTFEEDEEGGVTVEVEEKPCCPCVGLGFGGRNHCHNQHGRHSHHCHTNRGTTIRVAARGSETTMAAALLDLNDLPIDAAPSNVIVEPVYAATSLSTSDGASKDCCPVHRPSMANESGLVNGKRVNVMVDLGIRIDEAKNCAIVMSSFPEATIPQMPPLVRLRIGVYDRVDASLITCHSGPIFADTNWALPNVRHKRYVFGRQASVFRRAEISLTSILLVKLYSRPHWDGSAVDPGYSLIVRQPEAFEPNQGDAIVGWTVMSLFERLECPTGTVEDDEIYPTWQFKSGCHILPLYAPPVPFIHVIPPNPSEFQSMWRRLQNATVKLWVSRRGENWTVRNSTSENNEDSDSNSSVEEVYDQNADDRPLWVPSIGPQELYPCLVQPTAFTSEDGFDLYIDSAMNLPDFATVTKVAIRIGGPNFERVMSGDSYCYSQVVGDDVFNPEYNFRAEYRRLGDICPRATLIFKIYTIERFDHKLCILGYAYLNLFNTLGSVGQKQPIVDALQVCLNEGCFQLRLFLTPPCQSTSLSVDLPLKDRHRPCPCSSIFVRLVRAPKDAYGKTLSTADVPQSKWLDTGLLKVKPSSYYSGQYWSESCKPTPGELRVFSATIRSRRAVSVKSTVIEMAKTYAERDVPPSSQELMQAVLERLLSRFGGVDTTSWGVSSVPFGDPDRVAVYDAFAGFAVKVEAAVNLPWTGPTFGHLTVNPPAAYYLGQPFGRFDKPKFLRKFDLESTPRMPRWQDGYFRFTARSYNRLRTVVIHIQEISIRRTFSDLEFGFVAGSEAWTLVPIFVKGGRLPYVANACYALPLFAGEPPMDLLASASSSESNLLEWVNRNVDSGRIQPLFSGIGNGPTSVCRIWVSVCDARRLEECTECSEHLPFDKSLLAAAVGDEAADTARVGEVSANSIPKLAATGALPACSFASMRTLFSSLVGGNPQMHDRIVAALPRKYRQLVNKLYFTRQGLDK